MSRPKVGGHYPVYCPDDTDLLVVQQRIPPEDGSAGIPSTNHVLRIIICEGGCCDDDDEDGMVWCLQLRWAVYFG